MSVNPLGSPSLPVGSTEEVLTSIGGKLTVIGVAGGGGGGDLVAVVFEPTPTVASTSLQSARSANQMPGDASVGMTNLGSDSTGALPPNTGQYATVSGGDQNVTTTGAAAPNYATVAGGLNNLATNAHATIGGGTGNVASGDGATVPGGAENTASGDNSHAEGENSVASGQGSHAEGSSEASGPHAHSEGSNGSNASGDSSHAEGYGGVALAIGDHAEGITTQASGGGAHAEGNNTLASGAVSHAQGIYSTAAASVSHAEGENACAIYEASHVLAIGPAVSAPVIGQTIQRTEVVLRGKTPGLVVPETVALGFGQSGLNVLGLTDGKAYRIDVDAVVGADVFPASYAYHQAACVRCVGGVAILDGTGVQEAFGNALAATGALTLAVASNELTVSYTSPSASDEAAIWFAAARVRIIETPIG